MKKELLIKIESITKGVEDAVAIVERMLDRGDESCPACSEGVPKYIRESFDSMMNGFNVFLRAHGNQK